MSNINLIDLKVKIDKNSFKTIQNKCFKNSIFWDGSGAIKQPFNKNMFCLYFRGKSNTLQFGIHEYCFEVDNAKEVTVEDFLKRLSNE